VKCPLKLDKLIEQGSMIGMESEKVEFGECYEENCMSYNCGRCFNPNVIAIKYENNL
jgi:hypothetical protein